MRPTEPTSGAHTRGAAADPWPARVRALQAALPAFLLRQRWYPAKGAGTPEVRLLRLERLEARGLDAAVATWAVQLGDGSHLELFVPIAAVPGGEGVDAQSVICTPRPEEHAGPLLIDALASDAFVRFWLEAYDGDDAGEIQPGLRLQRLPLPDDARPPAAAVRLAAAAIARPRGEQSNTSLRLDETAILKVMRRIEAGAHPEVEMGRHLSRAGFDAAAPLLAWIEFDGRTLMVLEGFVRNEGDGWSWLLPRIPAQGARALAWVEQLGRRTAQMHRALARASDDPSFAPEPVGRADLEAWARSTREQAERVLQQLGPLRDAGGEDGALVERLVELYPVLDALLGDLTARVPRFSKTRHHGDFHLGQVLVTGEDAVIIDFEGEPLRPLAQRRQRHCVLRDVAGMLRSFDYLAEAAARRHGVLRLATAEAGALREWVHAAQARFLSAWRAASEGLPSVPSAAPELERLLRFFLLDKALYEVLYELANRPQWAAIPVRGLVALLEGAIVRRRHRMPYGAECRGAEGVRFALWAPQYAGIGLELEGAPEPLAMRAVGEGWHELTVSGAGPGTRYRYRLPDGLTVPDPASRFQPQDVHGASEVIDPERYAWRDAAWTGRPWTEAVVYELHVGAFTSAGSFAGARARLQHLASVGITAVEVMPVSDFPGARNWGYDGVLPFAPDASYGRPEDLKAFVDDAHAHGIMVLLDVVYNHFGPEGAYLHRIAPEFFTQRHTTPWGAAINTDGREAGPVRNFFIENALYWIEEYHLDGLRLDAVHAILDESERHLLTELAERVRAANRGRHVHLVLENEANEAHLLARDADGAPRWYTAQWNDDVHHVLHVAVTGESEGYYGEYAGNTQRLGRALAEGFAFQGEVMQYRGRERGEPSAHLPPSAFIAFLQNHDQIGNRAFGERLLALAPAERVRAAAAVQLLLPQVPMIFMGEEWGTTQPFPFFCDFRGELADAVRRGRRGEFARFAAFQDPAARERIPDPTAVATFDSARLRWEDLQQEPHAVWLAWYRRVLEVRREQILPRLPQLAAARFECVGTQAVIVCWEMPDEAAELRLEANLAGTACAGFGHEPGQLLWLEGAVPEPGRFAPWTVRWSVTPASALARLALRAGIVPRFRNARGEEVRTPRATQQRLLAALGHAAGTEAEAAVALEALEARDWSRALAPVAVLRADASEPAVEVVLPQATARIAWRLQLESGAVHCGSRGFGDLELRAGRVLGSRALERRRLPLPSALPEGYHRLSLEGCAGSLALIVTPGRCHLPREVRAGARLWGIAAQLYLLRSGQDWGIGDYRDLGELIDISAGRGADVIGLNPLHALFPDEPRHASPYSPASRLLLNVLNIAIEALPELAHAPAARARIAAADFQQRLAAARAQPLVDYVAVADLKLPVLRELCTAARAAGGARWHSFLAWRRQRGELLERNCLFLALREHFAKVPAVGADWHRWPAAFQDPDSEAVREFAAAAQEEVEFLAWLQWLADTQLAAAAQHARDAGMRIGLYRDLAVGADRAGAETWVNARAVIDAAQVGAPPDVFNPAGQDWGLPPFSPEALREEAYASFIELIRANMRHAGALRIDHVMALQQLYWVPRGAAPGGGAYVRYPLHDLLGILALESVRHRCMVVGEDLGTVPAGFREHMAQAEVLSYRVLYFEQRGDGAFLSAAQWPKLALAVAGSHDLPTLRGWWAGHDLDLKARLGLYPAPGEEARQRALRARDREALLTTLRNEGLLPGSAAAPTVAELVRAAHAFLARTPCALALAQIDDLTDELEPVNVPASSDEHPNWRRRQSRRLDELAASSRWRDVTALFAAVRGAHGGRAPH